MAALRATFLTLCFILDIALVNGDDASKDAAVEDTMNGMMDSILVDLTEKYRNIQADEFWHPYVFGTGNINREVIRVESVEQHQISGEYKEWYVTRLGLKQYLIGMTTSSVVFYDSNLQRIASKELPQTLQTMEVFTQWDAENNSPAIFLLAVTTAPSILILKSTGTDFQDLGTFPLHFSVQSLSMCRVNNENKVLLLPATSEFPITLYNLEISKDAVQLWFLQRLNEAGFKTALVHQPDTSDSILLVAHVSHLQIYNFDSTLGQYSVQQTLPLQRNCERMLPFTMMYQHYIACSSESSTAEGEDVMFISYNYNMNEYEDKDAFKQIAADKITSIAIEGTRDDSILLRRDKDGTVDILTYNGQKEFQLDQKCTLGACSEITNFNGTSFIFEGTTAYLLPTPAGASAAPVIVFITNVVANPSPVFQQSLGLFGEFKAMSQEMDMWKHVVSQAESTLQRKLNTEGNNVITGNWNLQTISTDEVEVEGRGVHSESMFDFLHFGGVQWTEQDLQLAHEEITSKLGQIDTNTVSVFQKLNDALRVTSAEQQIVSGTTEMHGTITADNVEATDVDVDSLWGQKTGEFLDSLAAKNSDLLAIQGGLVLKEPSSATRLETKTVNGVPVDTFARLSADNVFNCETSFESIESQQNIEVETVNGMDLAQNVVTVDDIQGLHFTDGIVAYKGAETVTSLMFDDILLSSGSQTVESPFIFDSLDILPGVAVDTFNKHNFNEFVSKVITSAHQGKITGTKTLKEVTGLDSLFLSGMWNELNFPVDFFPTSNPSVTLTGLKSFARLTADQVFVEKEVDGINTRNVVSLSEPESLSSEWTFSKRVKILNDIDVGEKVDGIFMQDLVHTGILSDLRSEYRPNADVEFMDDVVVSDLVVGGTLNGKSFSDTFDHMILFDDNPVTIRGNTIMDGDVVFKDLQLAKNKINANSIENFLTRDTPQTIQSPVVMTNEVLFDEMYAVQHFDGVLIQDVLQRAFKIQSEQSDSTTTIPWDIHFDTIACQGGLSVNGPINGMPNYGRNVARTRGLASQSFSGPIVMNSPNFNTLSTAHLQLDPGHTVQTLDVVLWNTTRAKLSEAAHFSLPFSVNRITTKGNLDTEIINGVLVDDLRSKVFRTDVTNQEFKSHLKMGRGLRVENGDLQFTALVDGWSLADTIQHGFPLRSNNMDPIVISEDWKFESLKTQGDMIVSGRMCGVDLAALQEDSVKRGETTVELLGEKTFTQPVEVTGSLVSPQINGKPFLEHVFLLHEDQDIKSHVSFASHSMKDMVEVDSINNLPVSWLSQIYQFQDGQHVLNHDVIMKDSVEADALRVGGTTQTINLDQFLADAVKLSDPSIVFSQDVIMESPILAENDVQVGSYNGLDFTDLTQNIVMLSDNVVFERPVTFAGGVKAPAGLTVGGNLNAKKLSNGVDLNDLQANAYVINDPDVVLEFKDVKFDKLVAFSPIQISTLNGIPFENYVTLDSPQDLGTLRISNLILTDAIVDVKGNVGHFDISEEFKDTLMSNSAEPQSVMGNTVIRGPVQINKNLNCFGPQLKEQVITLRDDVVIQGPIEFSAPLIIRGDTKVSQSLQGHTVESLFANTFTADNNEVIRANWAFRGPVTFKDNVSGSGLKSEKLDLQALVEEKHAELRSARSEVDNERKSFISSCRALHTVGDEMARSALKLDAFDSHQVIALRNEAQNVLTAGTDDNVMLFVQTTSCQLQRYRWEQESQLFHKVVEASPVIGRVNWWQSATPNKDTTVVVFSTIPSDCSKTAGFHFFTVSPSTPMDFASLTIETISEDNIKSFKLKTVESTGEVALIALFKNRADQLDMFRWNGAKFEQSGVVPLGESMERIDVVATAEGFGIMCHNEESVHMYDISTTRNTVLMEAQQVVLASLTSPLAIFNNFGVLYALVPESGASAALIQPSCSFQLMRLMDGAISTVQKLQVPEVVAATHWSFGNHQFIGLLSKSYGLYVYKFMGLSGLQLLNTPFQVYNGLKLRSFSIATPESSTSRPFILMMSPNAIEIYGGNVYGDRFATDFQALCNI